MERSVSLGQHYSTTVPKIIKNNNIEYKHICNFCKKEFKSGQKLGSHITSCVKNPNYEIIYLKRKINFDKIRKKEHTKEDREKLSDIVSERVSKTGYGGFNCVKRYCAKNINNEDFLVRGTWEFRIAEWFNSSNILFEKHKYLKYFDFENVRKTYVPDFYLPDSDIYIEIKGYYKEEDKRKMKFVTEQNDINLFMIFGDKIKKLDSIINLDQLLKDCKNY